MIQVKVAEFRNKLSSYLKKVRLGAQVIITDRDTPIGRLSPYQEDGEESFELSDPPLGFGGLAKIKFIANPKTYHVVDELLSERQRR